MPAVWSGSNNGSIGNSYAAGTVGANITGTNLSTAIDVDIAVGGLVGANGGSITQSYATGAVSFVGANMLADIAVGGLVGSNYGTISNAYASGPVGMTVTGASPTDDSGASAGGLVGYNSGSITYAYITGAVTVGISSAPDQSVSAYVGGLVGTNDYGGTVTQAYASGAVTGGSSDFVGGLVGSDNSGTGITASYWDIGTTGQQHSSGSSTDLDSFGLTTANAMKQSSYVGWNFGSDGGDWFMIDGQTRPFLRSEWSSTITNSHQLQLMAMRPGASYTLANNISLGPDLQNPSSMWSAAGFVPIGNINVSLGQFTGTFDGQNHTIDGLTIAPTVSTSTISASSARITARSAI